MYDRNRHDNITPNTFDIKKAIKKQFNCTIVGQPNSGKSVLVADILYHLSTKKNPPRIKVFSSTNDSEGHFRHIPKTVLYDTSKIGTKLEKIVNKQKILEYKKLNGKIHTKTNLWLVVVLDGVDFMNIKNNRYVDTLFRDGRHICHTSIIITVNHLDEARPTWVCNSEYIFFFKPVHDRAKRVIYRRHFGIFDRFSQFNKILDTFAHDNECIVANNLCCSDKIEECVNSYKAYNRIDTIIIIQSLVRRFLSIRNVQVVRCEPVALFDKEFGRIRRNMLKVNDKNWI